MEKLTEFYKPHFDKKSSRTLYGNGRFTFVTFVILHYVVFMNILVIALIPLSYFIFIPMYLQHRVDLIGTKGNEIRIWRAAVGSMNDTAISFAGDFRVDPLLPLPVKAGILATTLYLTSNGQELVQIHIPENSFWMHKELILAFNGTMIMQKDSQHRVRDLIGALKNGTDVDLDIQLKAPLTTFGMVVYPALPLHRFISMGKIRSDIETMLQIATGPGNENMIMVPQAVDPVVNLRNFVAQENTDEYRIFKVFGHDIVWQTLDFQMDDSSATLLVSVGFENTTPLEVAMIEQVSFYCQVMGVRVAKIEIKKLGLAPGLNSRFIFETRIIFAENDPEAIKAGTNVLGPAEILKAIDAATANSILDARIGILGPVEVKGAEFVGVITKNMNIEGPIRDLVYLLPPNLLNFINDPAELKSLLLELPGILGRSKLGVDVSAASIKSSMSLNLPPLDWIVPPKNLNFPFASSISVYGLEGIKAIDMKMDPVKVTRLDNINQQNSGFLFETGANILPINTDVAARDLAASINPVLSSSPTSSHIGLKDLFFYNPQTGKPFKWCVDLFGERIVKVWIPGLDKKQISSLAAAIAPALIRDLDKIVDINRVDVKQISDRPGLSAVTSIKVVYPDDALKIHVDVGYLANVLSVEGTPMTMIEMPQGLVFKSAEANGPGKDFEVKVVAVVERNPEIASKVQNLVDALGLGRQGGKTTSFAGVTGIVFGQTQNNAIITFKAIKVEVDSAMISELSQFALQYVAKTKGLLSPGMMKIQGGSLAVKSATEVSVKTSAILKNPLPITMSVGSVAISTELDSKIICRVQAEPLAIAVGTSPVAIGMNLNPSMGGGGLAAKVSDFVDKLLTLDANANEIVGINGFVMNPAGGAQSGSIDQFKDVWVGLRSGRLFEFLSQMSGTGLLGSESPLDISAVLPSDTPANLLSKVNPQITFLKAHAVPGAKLDTGADIHYINPLPVTASVPYSAVSVSLEGKRLVDTAVSGLNLQLDKGSMALRTVMVFNNDAEMPDIVGRLVTDFLDGKLNTRVNIGSFYFGASDNARNDLFSALNADVTNIFAGFAHIGKDLKAELQDMISAPVDVGHLSRRQTVPSVEQQQDKPISSILSISGPYGMKAAVQAIAISFLPSKIIGTKMDALLELPFPVDLNIPYFSAKTQLDEIESFGFESGISAQGQKPLLKLGLDISVNDIPELSDRIAIISANIIDDKPLPGNVGAGHVLMGFSASDRISCFSKIGVSLGLDSVKGLLYKQLEQFSNLKTMNFSALGVSIDSVGLEAKPGKVLSTSFGLAFNNPFQISITGMNFMRADIGLDHTKMFHLQSPKGIGAISSGKNSLSLATDLSFNSEFAAKKAVQDFTTDITRNFGSTQAFFTTMNPVFGADESNAFQFLSKAVLGIKSSTIINQKSYDMVLDYAKKSGYLNITSLLGVVKPTSLAVQFNPSDVINSKVGANVSLPMDINLKMPYFSSSSFLNSHPLMNIGLSGLEIRSKQSNALSLDATVQLFGSENLQDSIASIAETAFKKGNEIEGTLGVGALLFGYNDSPENIIDTFSLSNIEIQMQHVTNPVLEFTRSSLASFNVTALLTQLNPEIRNFKAETLPGRILAADVEAGFTNTFPISVNGLGYTSLEIGLDGQKVAEFQAFDISPQQTSLKASSKITFPKTPGLPEAVAGFAADILEKEVSTLEQNIFSSGIAFGYSKDHAFRLFSKAIVQVRAASTVDKKMINRVVELVYQIDFKGLLSNAALTKAYINIDEDSACMTEIGAGLSNVSFTAKAVIGYMNVIATLDNERIAEMSIIKPVSLETIDKKLNLDVTSRLLFIDTEVAQETIGVLVSNLMSGQPVGNKAGISGFWFGSDEQADNVIDTFSKVTVSTSIKPFIPIIKNLTNVILNAGKGLLNTPATGIFAKTGLAINNIDMDVHDEGTLVSNVALTLTNLPFDLQLNLPYMTTSVNYNKKLFVENTIRNLEYKGGLMKMQIFLGMPEDDEAIRTAMPLIGNILFHRYVNVTDKITAHSVSFGANKEKSVRIFSKVRVEQEINDYVYNSIKYVDQTRPIEILNINAALDQKGVECDIMMSFGMPYFRLLASTVMEARYQVNPKASLVRACSVPIATMQFPLVQLTLVPDLAPVGGGGSIDAFAQAATPLLTFRDFASMATLGYGVLTGTNGKIFRRVSGAAFNAGELIMFNPLVMNLVPTWPWNSANPFAAQVPIKAMLSFRNPGSLHIDIGRLEGGIQIAKSTVLKVVSAGNIVWWNANEGANVTDPKRYKNMGVFDMLLPLSNLNPVTVFKTIQSLVEGRGVIPDIKVYRGDTELTYFPYLLKGMGEAGVLENIVPFIGTILGHVNLQIGGRDAHSIPLIGRILRQIEDKALEIAGPKVESSVVRNNMLTWGTGSDANVNGNATMAVKMLTGPNFEIISH